MLIIEKGKSKTAPADTASVKVLKNNLQERRAIVSKGPGTGNRRTCTARRAIRHSNNTNNACITHMYGEAFVHEFMFFHAIVPGS